MAETGPQKIRTQAAASEWAARIEERRKSGLTVAPYCEEHKICRHSYYRWQKRLFEMAEEETGRTAFAELEIPKFGKENSTATLEINGTQADIYNGIDEYTLRILVRVMKSC